VYEHRALLENSFEKEKKAHKRTKQELEFAKREFNSNITRTKVSNLKKYACIMKLVVV